MHSDLSSGINKERVALILLPLLLLQLALLSMQIKGPSGTVLIKSWALTAQAPIVNICSSAGQGVSRIWQGYIWLVGARSENEMLHQRVDRLSLLNRSYEQALGENARLRQLLSLSDRLSLDIIGARVAARTPNYLANILYLDRGALDGVSLDAPVLSGSGIVGRITLVSERQSQVQLITNPGASMGAMLEQSRTPGVLKGSGDVYLELNYIGNTQPVKAGETVISSGLDKIYPKGIVIGQIVHVQKGRGVFQEIKVKPVMDLIHLEEVSILKMDSRSDNLSEKIDP